VTLYEYPDVPEYDWDKYVLCFPSSDSHHISEVSPDSYEGVVFVDSQWQQAGKILRDPRVSHLRKIRMTDTKTNFWRYQSVGDHCLATVRICIDMYIYIYIYVYGWICMCDNCNLSLSLSLSLSRCMHAITTHLPLLFLFLFLTSHHMTTQHITPQHISLFLFLFLFLRLKRFTSF
jgi:hypothetical protein